MMNMTAKVSFELTKEGRVTIEVNGNKSAVKAGLLSIVERIADIEEVPMEDYIDEMRAAATFAKEIAKDPGIILSEILNNLFGGDDEEPEGCDGDCDNCDRHEKMPEEMKEFFDKMFGGLN
jgi:hypothetical protein